MTKIKEVIEQNGGKCTNAVTKKTTFILLGDNPGLSKKNKANELNIDIKTEQEFIKLIKHKKLDRNIKKKNEKGKQLNLFN